MIDLKTAIENYEKKVGQHQPNAGKHFGNGLLEAQNHFLDDFKKHMKECFLKAREPYLYSNGEVIKGYSSFEEYWKENFKHD